MCDILINILIITLLVVLSPLLLVEILLLMFCGVKWLPPLSCMLSKSDMTGKFSRSDIPPHPEIPAALLDKKDDITLKGMVWYRPKGSVSEQVKTMCELMLAYNVVPSSKECPEDLQGVFWMDGNSIPEELACLSYAAWDEQNNTFVLNKVNGNCSWTYLDSSIGRFIAWFQERGEASGMQVFQFKARDLKEGRIWSCTSFDYESTNWLTSLGKWTMDRLDGPGVSFKRGCYWFHGAFGDRLEFGSYTLRKIMNTDGTPLEPAYSEFVKYMETTRKGTPMITEAPHSEGAE